MKIGDYVSVGWLDYETAKTAGGTQVFVKERSTPFSFDEAVNLAIAKFLALKGIFPDLRFVGFKPSATVQAMT